MKRFEEFVSDDTINWLLEDDNPSVKYYTLIDLLGKTFDDEDVTTAKKQIMKTVFYFLRPYVLISFQHYSMELKKKMR